MATANDEFQTERCQVKKHLGSGGSGDAYLAWDASLRREIAIKHPNIVSIYDISLIDGAPCIVMEFVQGPGQKPPRGNLGAKPSGGDFEHGQAVERGRAGLGVRQN